MQEAALCKGLLIASQQPSACPPLVSTCQISRHAKSLIECVAPQSPEWESWLCSSRLALVEFRECAAPFFDFRYLVCFSFRGYFYLHSIPHKAIRQSNGQACC